MDSKQIYRDYIIRYYPESDYKHNPMLIGLPMLIGIVARNETIDKILRRLENNTKDRLTVRLDRGCTIVFVGK